MWTGGEGEGEGGMNWESRINIQTLSCVKQGFPRWLGGKESIYQCRRLRFDSWVGKIPWRRKWEPTPVFLPGKSYGHRSLVGNSPWGHKESDMTEHTHTCVKQIASGNLLYSKRNSVQCSAPCSVSSAMVVG